MVHHREHNCIDRPSLESIIAESKGDLINYFLNDALKIRRAEIVEQLDQLIKNNESRGSNVLKSIVGQETAIATCNMSSTLCILKKLCSESEGKDDKERVA